MMKEALLYQTQEENKTTCSLCAHRCQLAPDKYGICGVRQNRDGKLYTHVYGEVIAAHLDPIEKKPLYHFLPGSLSFSMATVGCNFRCSFCQNWQISQGSKETNRDFSGRRLLPAEIVQAALRQGCRSISYTYTEPTIYFEYAYDTAQAAAEAGLRNVFVTNGFMTSEALDMIHPHLHACNVDLKSFREDFYKNLCGARLQPVLDSIRHMHRQGIWIEITTLLVPGENDSSEELEDIAAFIAGIDPDIPWHISRFHPDFQYLESHPTPMESLRTAFAIGQAAGLRFIYIGNVWGESEDTRCPHCGESLISRQGFSIRENRLTAASCPQCGHNIAGVF